MTESSPDSWASGEVFDQCVRASGKDIDSGRPEFECGQKLSYGVSSGEFGRLGHSKQKIQVCGRATDG